MTTTSGRLGTRLGLIVLGSDTTARDDPGVRTGKATQANPTGKATQTNPTGRASQ